VHSYFNRDHLDSTKTRLLVKAIKRIEFTVVDTETDALLLESSLIKQHQPRFNINLKDDKSYPWICITNDATYDVEHDKYNPSTFVAHIQVPVFLTGSWQDEQTGPYFFLLFNRFTNAPALRITATNGVHIDGFGPAQLVEWQTFLELFVAKRRPLDPMKVRNISPLLYSNFFSAPLTLPASRFSSYATYEEALAAWKAEPPLHVLFENGAGVANELGAPEATFAHDFMSWPPPETSITR
jgi:hypothetical protein